LRRKERNDKNSKLGKLREKRITGRGTKQVGTFVLLSFPFYLLPFSRETFVSRANSFTDEHRANERRDNRNRSARARARASESRPAENICGICNDRRDTRGIRNDAGDSGDVASDSHTDGSSRGFRVNRSNKKDSVKIRKVPKPGTWKIDENMPTFYGRSREREREREREEGGGGGEDGGRGGFSI